MDSVRISRQSMKPFRDMTIKELREYIARPWREPPFGAITSWGLHQRKLQNATHVLEVKELLLEHGVDVDETNKD